MYPMYVFSGYPSVFQHVTPPPRTSFFPPLKTVDLRSLYHATLAAPLLGADVGQEGASVLEKVLDLLGSDGSVRWVRVLLPRLESGGKG